MMGREEVLMLVERTHSRRLQSGPATGFLWAGEVDRTH